MARIKKPTVALIYDFDGTLSPGNMQEYGFIQAAGLDPQEFWRKNTKMKENQDASEILCYMKLMVEEARHNQLGLSKKSLMQYGKDVDFFTGVKEWFGLIKEYGEAKGVKVEHYINSSGLKEIIEGTSIAREFKRIYASSFYYSPDGAAEWPAVAVDFTAKTQFLFMINKGVEFVKDNKMVNEYKPEIERPIPFKHMVYFGDGETDVPCMKLIKQQGGRSIAVYNQKNRSKRIAAEKLIAENRVNFVCPADYSKGSEIYNVVTTIIDKIKSDFEFKQLLLAHEKKGKKK